MKDEEIRQETEEPQVMSKEDVHDYQGLTLSENGTQEERQSPRGYTYVHFQTVEIKEIPWWKKALFLAGAAVVMGLIVVLLWFFFLGGALFFIGAGIIYALLRLMKKGW